MSDWEIWEDLMVFLAHFPTQAVSDFAVLAGKCLLIGLDQSTL